MIEDDTVAPDLDELGGDALAPTQEDVEQAIGWHRLILPLMVNPMEDESLIVGTRWYDHDLISYVKENEPQYRVITRACREDEDGLPSQIGEITYPERFNASVLQELEASLGPYMFSCLYLNQPVRSEDMVFKPEWIRYYETRPRTASLMFYTTIDPATDPQLAKGKDTDYSVVMTTAKDMVTGRIYVIEYFREKCNPGEMASAIFDHVVKYRPIVVGYEDIAYQRSLDYWLKELMRQQGIYFILEPIKGVNTRSKPVRISALQPLFASGSILLRSHMKELVSELIKYPLDRHDDLPDCLSMGLQLWNTTKAESEYKQPEDRDPMVFDNAVQELKNRHKHTSGNLIFDPLEVTGQRVYY
jgi:predicted phage terminase large subunit-like protein